MEEITVTKRFSFCYGHYLPEYEGCCKNQHGHNSALEVTFNGNSAEKEYPTMVVDFSKIKKYVQPFVDKLDHQNLNDFFTYPTAETILRYFASEIQRYCPFGDCLVKMRLWETPDSYSTWRRLK